MRSFALTFALSLLLLVIAGTLSACDDTQATDDAEESNRRSIAVEVLELEPRYFEDVIELSGTVEALNDARLSAQASGTITQMVPRGAPVAPGQTVAQLDPREAQAAVAQAEAQVESARAQYELALDNFERQEPLYRDSVISAVEFETVRTELNQARASLRQSEAQLDDAQSRLENTRVVAPFAGRVEERMVETGEQISMGAEVARVVSTSRVRVSAGVPERYADDVSETTPVQVDVRGQGMLQNGRITFVGDAVDPQSRTFPIEIELPNPNRQLKPQMVARVYLTRETMEDALVVPRPAIIRDETGTNVYVVDETDAGPVANLRAVTVGTEYGNEAVIVSGLNAGDRVIVTGQNNLSPGDALTIEGQYEDTDNIDIPEPEEDDDTLDGSDDVEL